MDTHTFTLTAGDTSASVTLPAANTTSSQGDGSLGKQRIDTDFAFRVAVHDEPISAEAFSKKTRTDTSFKFERQAIQPGSESDAHSDLATLDVPGDADSVIPDDASDMAGRKRQDTNFKFEITTSDPSADDAADLADALGGRTRKDTSFEFEIIVSPPDSDETLGSTKRKSTSFSFERAATPGSSVSGIVRLSVTTGITVALAAESP